MWTGSWDSLLLPPPSATTTINLRKFLCLHAGQHNSHESLPLTMQLEWNDVSPPPPPVAPDTPNQALRRMYRQWQQYLADVVRKSRYPTSYYTQHCFPWLQSHVLSLSLTSSKAQRSSWFAASLQTVRHTKPVWFPTLAALPCQFIFYDSRRLLGLYNVTLMRRVSGFAPTWSFFFYFWS